MPQELGWSVEAKLLYQIKQLTKALSSRSYIQTYANFASFPNPGITGTLYVDEATGDIYVWNGTGYVLLSSGITALNGLIAAAQLLVTGTSGTDFNISSIGTTHTFNIPTASAANRGLLSSGDWSVFNGKQNALTFGSVTSSTTGVTIGNGTASTVGPNVTVNIATASAIQNGLLSSTDWTTFNGKQNAITLTTTGTSGAATLVGSTLNIPQYQSVLTNPITGTGTTNYLSKFTGTTTLGNSQIFDNGTNVGIGTTGAGAKLTIEQTAAAEGLRVDGASGAFAFVVNGGNTNTTKINAGLTVGVNYFATTPPANGALFEGNVGIGTTSVNAGRKLQINGDSSDSFIQLVTTTSGTTSSDGLLIGVGNGLDAYILNYEISPLRLFTSGTERMRITSAGNVGIGTTTPSTLLDVRGELSIAYNASYGIRFYNQDRNNWSFIGNSIATGSSEANLRLGDATGEVIRLTGSKVLIGTTTDAGAYKLQVAGAIYNTTGAVLAASSGTVILGTSSATSDNEVLQVDGNGRGSNIYTAMFRNTNTANTVYNVTRWTQGQSGTATGYIGTGGSAVGNTAFRNNFVVGTQSSSALVFNTNDLERMRIDSSGNVGIGTATPVGYVKLTVQSGVADAIVVLRGADPLTSTSAAAIATPVTTGFSATPVYSFWYQSGTGIANPANNTIAFNTTGSERMRITSGGNVGIGTATPSTLLDVRGELSVAYNASYGIRLYNQDRNNWSFIGNSIATGSSEANLRLGDATGEVIRLTGGKVGIGTTSPTEKIETSGNIYINANAGLIVDSAGDKRIGFMKYSGREAGIWRVGAQDFEIGRITSGTLTSPSAYAVDLYLDSTGNVGIGTSSPTTYTGYTVLAINNTTGGVLDLLTNNVRFGFVYADNAGFNAGSAANIPSKIWSNSIERIRIFANGNVRIGSSFTDNGYLFQVGGQSMVVGDGGTGSSDAFIVTNAGNSGSAESGLITQLNSSSAAHIFSILGKHIFQTINTNPFEFLTTGSSTILHISNSRNVGIAQTTFGTGGTQVFAIATGATPSSSPADCFQLYSQDITAGNAAPHFRTENGAVVKVYQETTAVAAATFVQGSVNAVYEDSTFDGYTLKQIVKALRNQGLLA